MKEERSIALSGKCVVEKEFDNLAPVYEKSRLSSWYQAHSKAILEHCFPLKEGALLDIGCGTGWFLRNYLKKAPGVKGIGLDVSENMILEAKKKGQEENLTNLEFFKGDWETFDLDIFRHYQFDTIVCANTFHYFLDPQNAANKMFEQLDKGTLYILERDKAASPLTMLWGFLHSNYVKDQVTFYRGKELIFYFENAGFREVKIIRRLKKMFWKGKMFTNLILISCKKN